jgi:KRAB domain-containing zinc finger protein
MAGVHFTMYIRSLCIVQANADHDSDSASTSSYASLSAKSSSSCKSAENIEVKADFSSCTDSDGPEWESEVCDTQNTEDNRQTKESRRHQNANGTLLSRDISLSPLPRENKKRKMKHISESKSEKYVRKDSVKEESSTSQTSSASRRKLAQHECVFCNKRFRDRYHLVRHLSVHSGETAPDCKLCKTPRNCCGCVPHSPQYSPIKQHKCDICSKMFRDKYHLNRHSLVHTKEKPHQCEVCQKLFSRKDKLMQHSVLHD